MVLSRFDILVTDLSMVLIFDMDDTLYVEMDYVVSGFKAVSDYLHNTMHLPKSSTLEIMLNELEQNGRGLVFNAVLTASKVYSKALVKKCLSVYRLHKPNISLGKETKACLSRFMNSKKYVLTDGNKVVQAQKVEALGLAEVMDGIFITHRFGLAHSKPSPYCYFKIIDQEQVPPSEAVYIGDNPKKDFVGIKPLGFKTIRVLTGPYRNLKVAPDYQADLSIEGLDELTPELIHSIK